MTTDRFQEVWESLEDKEYRREFAADVGTGLAFQIRMLREKNDWTQEELAARTGKQQETISHWEDPNYGSYTLNSLKSLAGAFDVALVVRFAPFSELVKWGINLTPMNLAPKSYSEERLDMIKPTPAEGAMTVTRVFWDTAGLATAEPVVATHFELAWKFGTTASLAAELPAAEQPRRRPDLEEKEYARAA